MTPHQKPSHQRPDIRTATGRRVSPDDLEAIVASVSQVDEAARSSEAKWGCGRLVRLVSDTTLLKFKTLHGRWTQAYSIDRDIAETARLGASMIRAYTALDAEATAQGHKPLVVTLWEARTDDGRVFCVVRTEAEAIAVQRSHDGREMVVWTMSQLARIIPRMGLVAHITATFPGARIDPASPRDPGMIADWVNDPELATELYPELEA